jgi:hypothetical protein
MYEFLVQVRHYGDHPFKSGFKCKKKQGIIVFLWFKGLSRHLIL